MKGGGGGGLTIRFQGAKTDLETTGLMTFEVNVLPPEQNSNLFGADIVFITVVVYSVDTFDIAIGRLCFSSYAEPGR